MEETTEYQPILQTHKFLAFGRIPSTSRDFIFIDKTIAPREWRLFDRLLASFALGLFWLFTTCGLSAQTSAYVYEDANGDLQYGTYANHGQASSVHTVPDFSACGYKGGAEAIPFVPAEVIINAPSGGDDTSLIQNAIDQVAAMSVQANGFRGAVLIKAGNYQVGSTLTINTSGVVIRGEGSQASGGTLITMTATVQDNLFEVSGSGSPSTVSGSTVSVADSLVPVGAKSFAVSDASNFSIGDEIRIHNKMNAQWITDIGMGNIMDGAVDESWTASGYQLYFERSVTGISGNTITINAPLVQAIEDQYGGADVFKYTFNGQLNHIGFEGLRLESSFANDTDEAHGWIGIKFNNARDFWVRQVTGRYFGYGLISIGGTSHYATVEDCAMLDPKSVTTGGRKYSFSIDDASFVLMQRCYTWGGRHDFVSGSKTPGPNVFVDCLAENTKSDAGPHHRYATGQLYDNVKAGALNAQNRFDSGSGHGWAGAQIMFWNCDTNSIISESPVGAMNWAIGCLGAEQNGSWVNEPDGIRESHGTHVTPRSLYYRQLDERLGTQALQNLILPQQNLGTIWSDLATWAGEGQFLDSVLIWHDSVIRPLSASANLRGVVRNLPMLDNGISVTWSKLAGPGTVTFGDTAALETTATFSAEGEYELQLLVSDGSANLTKTITIWAADNVSNAAPAVDAGADQIVTLSESGDWSPAAIDTAAWFDASDAATITESDGVVSQWDDKSVHGNHATQAQTSLMPVSGSETINGVNALVTSASVGEHMDLASTITLSNHSIFGVLQAASNPVDLPTSMGVLAASQNSWDSYTMTFREPSGGYYSARGEDDSGAIVQAVMTGATTLMTPFMYGEVKVKGSSNVWYYDGLSLGDAGTLSADLSIGVLFRGYAGDPGSNGQPWDGRVGEIVIVDSALSDSDREKVEGYLAHKWGLVTNLPLAHPYKSAAPAAGAAVANLDGTVTDTDGGALTTTWSLVAGPANVSFADVSAIDTSVTFNQPGTYTLRLTADDGIDTADHEVTIQVGETPYDSWTLTTYSDSFDDTALISDPDSDGLINLQEFAFGLDPTSSSNASLAYTEGGEVTQPGLPVYKEMNGNPLALFLRRKDHADAGLTYTVVFSADLRRWTISNDSPTLRTGEGSSGEYEAVSVPYPASVPIENGGPDQAAQFFRIGVDGGS